ncbi:hypothetical protein N7452_001236 [Penicillium brevicompactum]|uniref:Uncharacterized protein n=1 Tax=Penicillium brevicompactum TaxID=5074 RepID=A0A9W9R1Y8_PENBR|nr:hypothetical protein N7452_001236 [Penicillium brevicompactum]
MPSTEITPEERRARLEEFLSGTSPNKAKSKGAISESLLTGVAFNVAHRHAQGKTLSPMENNLWSMLRCFVDSDAEAHEFGTMFSKAKQRMSKDASSTIFPQQVLDLTSEDAYTSENFHQDVKALGSEIAAQPNYKVVNLAQEKREDVENEDYLKAMEEAGGGVTVYDYSEPNSATAEEQKGSDGQKTDSNTAGTSLRLHLNKMKCLVSKGDQGGGKQEIYFSTSASAENRGNFPLISEELGSIVTGSERDFRRPPWQTRIFEGYVHECLTFHIECYEADQSNSRWYDGLMNIMRDLSFYCFEAAIQWSAGGVDLRERLIQAILGSAFRLVSDLMRAFRNNDDFVQRRSIGLTTSALNRFFPQVGSSEWWDFNNSGVGKYRLWLIRQ